MKLSTTSGLAILLMTVGLLTGCGPSIPPPEPPPGPALVWYPVGVTPVGGTQIWTACTPWAARYTAVSSGTNGGWSIDVTPAPDTRCPLANGDGHEPGTQR